MRRLGVVLSCGTIACSRYIRSKKIARFGVDDHLDSRVVTGDGSVPKPWLAESRRPFTRSYEHLPRLQTGSPLNCQMRADASSRVGQRSDISFLGSMRSPVALVALTRLTREVTALAGIHRQVARNLANREGRIAKYWRNTLSTALMVGLAGCDTFQGAQQPIDSTAAHVALAQRYPIDEAITAFGAGSDSARGGLSPQGYRDKVVGIRILAADARYRSFLSELHAARTGVSFGSDVSVLVLGALGALVGGATTKAVLAGASAAVAGTSASFSKNLFYDQTLPAIVTQMDANRDAQKLVIAKGLARDAASYTMVQAFEDVLKLEHLGSLDTAIKAITDAAARDADQKASELATFKVTRSPTDAAFMASSTGRSRQEALLAVIAKLPEAKAIALAQKPPVSNDELDKTVTSMVRATGSLSASQARLVLNRRIVLANGEAEIAKWEAAFKN